LQIIGMKEKKTCEANRRPGHQMEGRAAKGWMEEELLKVNLLLWGASVRKIKSSFKIKGRLTVRNRGGRLKGRKIIIEGGGKKKKSARGGGQLIVVSEMPYEKKGENCRTGRVDILGLFFSRRKEGERGIVRVGVPNKSRSGGGKKKVREKKKKSHRGDVIAVLGK